MTEKNQAKSYRGSNLEWDLPRKQYLLPATFYKNITSRTTRFGSISHYALVEFDPTIIVIALLGYELETLLSLE